MVHCLPESTTSANVIDTTELHLQPRYWQSRHKQKSDLNYRGSESSPFYSKGCTHSDRIVAPRGWGAVCDLPRPLSSVTIALSCDGKSMFIIAKHDAIPPNLTLIVLASSLCWSPKWCTKATAAACVGCSGKYPALLQKSIHYDM